MGDVNNGQQGGVCYPVILASILLVLAVERPDSHVHLDTYSHSRTTPAGSSSRGLVKNVRSMVRNLRISAQQALEVLDVPESERPRIIAML